ncbi:MAG: RecB family exonuclease [Burkholderiaceae bacterium]
MPIAYWPAAVQVIEVPLGDKFWQSAWTQAAQLAQEHPQLLILGHAHWVLAELANAAADAARSSSRAAALPRHYAVEDWLSNAVIASGARPVTGLQRQLLVQSALDQLAQPVLGAASDVARAALAGRLVQLVDDIDLAQFPYSNAARALGKLTAAEPFGQRELAITHAVAQALDGEPGAVQQQLAALKSMAARQHHPLLLLAPDRANWAYLRAISRVWQAPVWVLTTRWPEAPPAFLGDADAARRAAQRVHVINAPHVEAHAQSAALAVVRALEASLHGRVHVAALDRRAARRMRALLERAGIAVADASGWRLSTTAGCAVLTRLLDIAKQQNLADVLDWAKLPAVATSRWGLDAQALAWLELFIRQRGVARGLQALASRLRSLSIEPPQAQLRDAALAWVDALHQLVRGFGRTASVREHAARLRTAIGDVLKRLQADNAGAQIAAVLDALTQETAPQSVDFDGFAAVLRQRLEETYFIAQQPHARVVLLALNAAAWRAAAHVVVLGAQQGVWPQPRPAPFALSYSQRSALGLLPDDDGSDAFAALMARTVPMTCVLTRDQPDSRFDASPWLEELRAACAREAIALDWQDWSAQVYSTEARPITMPAPPAPFVPAKLSASALQALLACPYQFFALRLLGLAPLDALDDLPDRQDFGVLAHDWMRALHTQNVFALPSLQQSLEAAHTLLRASVQKQQGASGQDAAYAAFERLLARITPSVVRWGRAANSASVQAEVVVEQQWQCGGHSVVLHGRLDRVERDAQHAVTRIIDFKTAGKAALDQRQSAPWQFPQLLIYGMLASSGQVNADLTAAYLSLSGEDVTESRSKGDYPQQVAQLGGALDQALEQLFAHARLPAHGDAAACTNCAAAGVCRKGQWA